MVYDHAHEDCQSYQEILKLCEEVEEMMDSMDYVREVIKASEMKMTIHQKINAKANLARWYGPRSFVKNVRLAIKESYATEIRTHNTGDRMYYPQDGKTNYREPSDRQMGYEGNGEFASNH